MSSLDETHRAIMRLSRAPPTCSDADPIPDHVHQPWTGGATMKWEQVLAVASVRFLGKPKRFTVYYDILPMDTPQWRCACAFADKCEHRASRTEIHGQPIAYAAHKSDLMRIDLLEEHGGMYVDHDAFVLRSLDELRRCTVPEMRAGYEFFQRDKHKMNNGVLLARKGARFLSLWRDSYRQYRRDVWDHNSCIASYELAARHPELVHLDPDLAPLTRYGKREAYLRHLGRARVVHITGLFNAPWRQEDMRQHQIMRNISERVLAAAAAARRTDATPGGQIDSCIEQLRFHMQRSTLMMNESSYLASGRGLLARRGRARGRERGAGRGRGGRALRGRGVASSGAGTAAASARKPVREVRPEDIQDREPGTEGPIYRTRPDRSPS